MGDDLVIVGLVECGNGVGRRRGGLR